jgi:deoxyribonuclease-4
MRFGFHISISGGFARIIDRALVTQCQTIQFFTRNPRGWAWKELDSVQVRSFRTSLAASGIAPVFIHLPYLPNLASSNDQLFERSVAALAEELRRAALLGACAVIAHVGHRGAVSEDEAGEQVSIAINRALEMVPTSAAVLLENTAGQGTEIGAAFRQLRRIVRRVKDGRRIGICLDTAHAFAAGYDVSTQRGLEATLDEFENLLGLEKLRLLHLNDTKAALGSRVDRHWHIGEGRIGRAGFRRIVNHPVCASLPGIMETPRKTEREDLKNMSVIRKLVRS